MKKDIKSILLEETENVDLKMSKKLIDTKIDVKNSIDITSNNILSKKPRFRLAPIFSCFCLMFIFVFSFFSIYNNSFEKASAITTYILEINPSVCISTDKYNRVINAYSLNSDGDELLSDSAFDNINGTQFSDCLKSIIDISIKKGFIDSENFDRPRYIHFRVTNNQENFARDRAIFAKNIFEQELVNNGVDNYNINTEFLPVYDFRNRMGFNRDCSDLDQMREDIVHHRRFFDPNYIPPEPPPTP